ncbi:hypothetical protein C8F01DRAFT_1119126 [Mycena amicta]|nr:hypothetical protein C8F01DRAFT_1119126 [Mycena amicta]
MSTSLESAPRWMLSYSTTITNIFLHHLGHETTPQQLLALFDAPETLDMSPGPTAGFYYYACAFLIEKTQSCVEAGEHIVLIAGLFGLLKAEGLRRDNEYGLSAMLSTVVGPTIRQLGHDVPVPPGYRPDDFAFKLVQDPEYEKGDSFPADLVEYTRQHEGQLRFWALVGRLDADGHIGAARGAGTMVLLLHQGEELLYGVEDEVNRDKWDTLWAGVLHCETEMSLGQWGSNSPERLADFKEAARKIAGDERVSLLWRGRFMIMLDALEKER